MIKKKNKYFLVIALLIISGVFVYMLQHNVAGAMFSADLNKLPLKMSGWSGSDQKLEKIVKDALNADSILSRSYVNHNTGDSVGLLIVYRKYGRRDFAHRPEMCYPAAGWELVGKKYITLTYQGKQVKAMEVTAEKAGARDIVVYFFASGDRTESNFIVQQYKMSFDRLSKQKYGWSFIRFNAPSMESDEKALENIRNFAKDIDKPLSSVLNDKL